MTDVLIEGTILCYRTDPVRWDVIQARIIFTEGAIPLNHHCWTTGPLCSEMRLQSLLLLL